MSTMDTTENPKEYLGREKDCIQYIPMKLILRLARVHKLGADKYGQKNWRVQPVRMSTYYNAMFRHMVEWFEGLEDMDPESKEHHLLHVVACALIILDGIEKNSIADDRAFAEVKTGKLAGSQSAGSQPNPIVGMVSTGERKAIDPATIAKLEATARTFAEDVAHSQTFGE